MSLRCKIAFNSQSIITYSFFGGEGENDSHTFNIVVSCDSSYYMWFLYVKNETTPHQSRLYKYVSAHFIKLYIIFNSYLTHYHFTLIATSLCMLCRWRGESVGPRWKEELSSDKDGFFTLLLFIFWLWVELISVESE